MVTICSVESGSVCESKGIKKGDTLISVNGHEINDVLDYRFYIAERKLTLELLRDGKKFSLNIRKNEYDDIGLEFKTYLMDKKRSCCNKCIFCFIDQNPPGMRESIYFKDDDERLSFLQGSYITLTNLSEHDIERIITMKISPINVSVHSMNKELRVKLTGNKFAGEKLAILQKLNENGIALNLQFVLCRGINDGEELEYSLREAKKLSSVESISVVPAGLTCHRNGLYPLISYDSVSACEVIDTVEKFNTEYKAETGKGKVFCSDEFYLLAGRKLPESDYYEGFAQYDNGVGMISDLRETFGHALEDTDESSAGIIHAATGEAAYPIIRELAEKFNKKFPERKIEVHKIVNDFYGHTVTVSGLIVGKDYVNQLRGKVSGTLLISRTSLDSEGKLFLDGMTPEELEKLLNVKLVTVTNDGYELCEAFAT